MNHSNEPKVNVTDDEVFFKMRASIENLRIVHVFVGDTPKAQLSITFPEAPNDCTEDYKKSLIEDTIRGWFPHIMTVEFQK